MAQALSLASKEKETNHIDETALLLLQSTNTKNCQSSLLSLLPGPSANVAECKTCPLCKRRCQKSSDTLLPLCLQDYNDAEQLLAPANVDYEALCNYAYDAADFSTGGGLPDLQFAQNHAGRRDVAMFDFTCMHRAENASLVKERRGKKLLIGLVGDCLVEVGSSTLRSFPLIHIINNAR